MSLVGGSILSDLIVKQYLLSRNYSNTLKALDQDTKHDKNRGRYQAHKLVDVLLSAVLQTDLTALRESWQSLEFCLFRHLDYDKKLAASALKHSLYKCYLVEAVRNKHPEKVNEFFEQLALELQQESSEWKEWLMFPYMKNPQEHKTFSMYFTRSWMDIFLLSFHNFLGLVLASASKPILQQIDALEVKSRELARENKELRRKLHGTREVFEASHRNTSELAFQDCYLASDRKDSQPLRQLDPSELLEDFSTLGSDQEPGSSATLPASSTGADLNAPPRGFVSNVIRKISSPSSPLFRKKTFPLSPQLGSGSTHGNLSSPQSSRKIPAYDASVQSVNRSTSFTTQTSGGPINLGNRLQTTMETDGEETSSDTDFLDHIDNETASMLSPKNWQRSNRVESVTEESDRIGEVDNDPEFPDVNIKQKSATLPVGSGMKRRHNIQENLSPANSEAKADPLPSGLMELGQDQLREHHSPVSHVRFSRLPSTVGSLDAAGSLFFWQPTPTPRLMRSASSRGTVFSFDWRGKSDRLIIVGNKASGIRLFDLQDNKTVHEVSFDPAYPRIHVMESFPSGDRFLCGGLGLGSSMQPVNEASKGRLSVWDGAHMKTLLDLQSPSDSDPNDTNIAVNSCLIEDTPSPAPLIITGGTDGFLRLYDIRQNCQRPFNSWRAHGNIDGPNAQCLNTVLTPDAKNVYSLGTDGRLMLWSLASPGRPLLTATTPESLGGPFTWIKQAGGFKQTFNAPRGYLIRINPAGDAMITCAENGARIYQIHRSGDVIPWLTLGGHESPVISLDWYWGEETVTCLTASMDGVIFVTSLMKTAK